MNELRQQRVSLSASQLRVSIVVFLPSFACRTFQVSNPIERRVYMEKVCLRMSHKHIQTAPHKGACTKINNFAYFFFFLLSLFFYSIEKLYFMLKLKSTTANNELLEIRCANWICWLKRATERERNGGSEWIRSNFTWFMNQRKTSMKFVLFSVFFLFRLNNRWILYHFKLKRKKRKNAHFLCVNNIPIR